MLTASRGFPRHLRIFPAACEFFVVGEWRSRPFFCYQIDVSNDNLRPLAAWAPVSVLGEFCARCYIKSISDSLSSVVERASDGEVIPRYSVGEAIAICFLLEGCLRVVSVIAGIPIERTVSRMIEK